MDLITKREKQILRDFFIWCSRKAKIDVIDAEKHIELDGYGENLHPIMNLDEVINLYANEYMQENNQ